MVAAVAFAALPKISRDLDAAKADENVDVIVQSSEAPTPAQHERITGKGGKHKGDLSAIKSGFYSIQGGLLRELADNNDVIYISRDRPVSASSYEYAPTAVNAPLAWAIGADANNVGVAVIDSGINAQHPDL